MAPEPRLPFAQNERGFVYTRLACTSRLRPDNPFITYPSHQPPPYTREQGNSALNPVKT